MEILDVIQQPFMIRAIYGGLIIAILCAILGVFITLKRESFLADAVAHASLSGVAVAFVLSYQPIFFALAVGIFMAISITYLKKNTHIAPDSLIGMFYAILFAIGIVVINLSTEYQPELSTYLFGSILSITWTDIIYAVIALVVTLSILIGYYNKLVYATFDPEAAYIRGVDINKFEYIINILTSIAIIISIKVVGIILVTALLIIPASSAKLIAGKFKHMLPIALIQSIISVLVGILFSYYFETPTGATIVIVSGSIFILILLGNQIKKLST